MSTPHAFSYIVNGIAPFFETFCFSSWCGFLFILLRPAHLCGR